MTRYTPFTTLHLSLFAGCPGVNEHVAVMPRADNCPEVEQALPMVYMET